MNEWVWKNGGMILRGENRSTGRKTSSSATSSNANLKCSDLWLNPSLRYEKPANERLKTKIILNYFNDSFYGALLSVYSSKPSGHYIYHTVVTTCITSLTQTLRSAHTVCLCVFVDLRTNNDYFPTQH